MGNDAVRNYFDAHHFHYQIFIDGEMMPDPGTYDIIVKSSGIHFDTEFLLMAEKLSKPVVCDLELAYLLYPNREIITVTGTNGKTTTVNLIYELLKTQKKVILAGNVGIPIFSVFEEEGLMVVEASSFMLHDISKYHSHVSVLLNFLPNHLEYHHSFENYVNDKLKLIGQSIVEDYIVYNDDDDIMKSKIGNACSIKIPFSLTHTVDGAYCTDGKLYYKDIFIMDANQLKIPGIHNVANALAAICVAMIYGIGITNIIKALRSFKGIVYRIEDIGCFRGTRIINDSKSTNPHALLTALRSFEGQKILLVAGGKDKNDDFSILKNRFKDVKKVLLYGQNRHILAGLFREEGIAFSEFDTLDDVMKEVRNELDGIDVLLFSPGSSSYDQYQNFEKRGDHFRKLATTYFVE